MIDSAELNRLQWVEQQVRRTAGFLREDARAMRRGVLTGNADVADGLDHAAQQIEDILEVAPAKGKAITEALAAVEQAVTQLTEAVTGGLPREGNTDAAETAPVRR